MNQRERVQAIFRFEQPDRLPVYQFESIMEGAIRQWTLEGMPIDRPMFDYLGLESPIKIDLDFGAIPRFVERTIDEDEGAWTKIDEHGFTVRVLKSGGVRPWLTYNDVKGPIETREDWNNYKKLLDPHDIRRYPKSWGPAMIEHLKTAEKPVYLQIPWGPGRGVKNGYMLGVERLLSAIYEEPEFIEDIFDFWADFTIELIRPVVDAVPLDWVKIGEDGIAYKNSTIISPNTYRKLWQPYVRRVVDFIRSRGVKVVQYQSSGNLEPLIPASMEIGFNMYAPLECQAGMDAVALRKEYGSSIILCGNIAREAFMGDRAAIEKEFYSKVPWLVEQGGFIPTPDDSFMPDWRLDTMRHYVQLVKNFAVK